MPSIAVAASDYLQVLSSLKNDITVKDASFPEHALSESLRRFAVPAIHELYSRLHWQKLVLQPLEVLLPDCRSEERSLIIEIKRTMSAIAQLVMQFVQENRTVFQLQAERWEPRQDVSLMPSVHSINKQLERVSLLIDSEWASAKDYFAPLQSREAHLSVDAFNEELLSIHSNQIVTDVGNLTARCLLARVQNIVKRFEQITFTVRALLIAAHRPLFTPWDIEYSRLCDQFAELEKSCLHLTHARLAEMAIILLQVGVHFAPHAPELDWLPLEHDYVRSFWSQRPRLLQRKRNVMNAHMIGNALQAMTLWESTLPPRQVDIDTAIAAGGLVVVTDTREVCWDHQRVPVDWYRYNREWELLLKLAKSHRRGNVGIQHVYGCNTDIGHTALPNLKSRLRNHLPATLRKAIQPVPDQRRHYRLKLEDSNILIF